MILSRVEYGGMPRRAGLPGISELCRWLHEQLEQLPHVRFPFKLELLPENGIYFFYEFVGVVFVCFYGVRCWCMSCCG